MKVGSEGKEKYQSLCQPLAYMSACGLMVATTCDLSFRAGQKPQFTVVEATFTPITSPTWVDRLMADPVEDPFSRGVA